MPFPVVRGMGRKIVLAAIMPALLLSACDRAVDPPEPGRIAADPIPAPARSPGEPTASVTPRLAPSSVLTPEAEKGVEGARDILLAFARAIERERFDQAWTMLGPRDRERWPQAEFTKMFADLDTITVAVPDGEQDAGAGSVFYVAPIAITANDKAGRPVRHQGEARLRRVNDVDGSTAAQRRWHFERLTLDWTH